MEATISSLKDFAIQRLPDLLVPVAILVAGWFVALFAGYLVRGILRRTQLDDRIAQKIFREDRPLAVDTAAWMGKAAYYIVLVFTLLAFLQTAHLTAVTKPIEAMLGSFLEYLPRVLGAGAIMFVAWLTATLARRVLAAAVTRFDIDQRIAQSATSSANDTSKAAPVGKAMAETAYWLVLLAFTPAVLGALQLEGLLVPVQGMVDKVLGFLPNLVGAGLILVVGWFVARLGQRLSSELSSGIGVDRLGERVGMTKMLGARRLSSFIGLVVYALILLPVAVATLNALQLEAVTAPASRVLQTFTSVLPSLFGATLLIAIAYFAARLLSSVATKLLQGAGFDELLSQVGIARDQLGERTPSGLVGGVVVISVLLFAIIEAAQMLGFTAVASFGSEFVLLGGRVLLGLVIFGVGMFLANLAARAVLNSGVTNGSLLSGLIRAAVLVLAGAMALRQMGIADGIIELAFGFAFGAIAVAASLAFGLGGREAASKTLEELRVRLQPTTARQDTTPTVQPEKAA